MSTQQSESSVFWQWVAEAKRLRAAHVEAEADFLRHLADGEKKPEIWNGAGYTTFAALLDGENLCRPARFEEFKAAVARFGWQHVRSIGFKPSRLLLSVPEEATSRSGGEESAAAAAVADLEAFRERNHTTPSAQQARVIIGKHYETPRNVRAAAPALTAPETRIAELERENAKLKRENARLTKALAAAEARAVGQRSNAVDRSQVAKAAGKIGDRGVDTSQSTVA